MNGLSGITKVKNQAVRLFTAENVYGKKGAGGMAEYGGPPQSDVTAIGQLWEDDRAPRELGAPWKIRPCISLAPESVTTIVDTEGPGRFTHIWITVDRKRHRDLILRMYWDGEDKPSVEAPLGDFFCMGWRKHWNVLSIPINVNPTGAMNSYFPMPFRKAARITVENLAPEKIGGFFYAISMEEGPVADDEAYFHASFNRTNPVAYGDNYVIVDNIRGKGHYVGTYMAWQQNVEGWWGEGEFKAFIDGDKEYPTYCGTGTEDYFGGAWAFNGNFSAPFLGYIDHMTVGDSPRPMGSVGNRHSMYRFHLLDPIRFQSDFRAEMQTIGWRSETRFLPLMDDIASVAYWYQLEPHAPFKAMGTRNDLEVI